MNRTSISFVVAFFFLTHAVPAAAACTSGEVSVKFLTPSPSFSAYTVETKTIRAEPCGIWWTSLSVNFSSNEPALALYDDGRHDDGGDNDGVYGAIWRPVTAGPVTLGISATNPYSGATVSASLSGQVRPRYYGVESVPFQWIDATTGARQQTGTSIPIGFDFNFYGVPYNSLSATIQGALILGGLWTEPYVYNAGGLYLTSFGPAAPNNVIAPFWDIYLDTYSGAMYTLLEGSAPNRRFTISWNDITFPEYCSGNGCFPYDTGSFQATLYEGSNDIVYRYLDVAFGGAAGDPGTFYTVGVENSDGTQASTYYSHAQNINPPTPMPTPVTSQSALRFFVSSSGPINQSPSANAGADQSVNEGATVILAGSGTDPDGAIRSYLWTQIAGPNVSLTNANTATTRFAAPLVTADTTLSFRLTVTDDRGATASDTVNVIVRNIANQPPTANAGPDQIARQQTTVSLNGSGSSDSDGSIVSYRWRQVAGKTVTLRNATSATATFTAPSTTNTINLTFELSVTDNSGATATDQTVVTVVRR